MASEADETEPGPDVTEVDDRGQILVDGQVPWRLFVAVGLFIGVSAIIYGATSKEHAGTVMLVTASILALWCGVFLWRNARRFERAGPDDTEHGESAMYLPEASPWPVGIGLGLALALNGLLIGTWFLVPGATLLAVSLAGFARQSRHRR